MILACFALLNTTNAQIPEAWTTNSAACNDYIEFPKYF